jgi:hypothetical protein
MRTHIRGVATCVRAHVASLYAGTLLLIAAVAAQAPSAFAAGVGCATAAGSAGGIGTAFGAITGLLLHVAAPAAGLGFVVGGVWHSVTHDPRGQEAAKNVMKGSLVGLAGSLLGSGIVTALGTALCG